MFKNGFEKTAAGNGSLIRGAARGLDKGKTLIDGGAGIGKAITRPLAFAARKGKETRKKIYEAVSNLNKNFERGSLEAWKAEASKSKDALHKFEREQRIKNRTLGESLAARQFGKAKRQANKGKPVELKTTGELQGRNQIFSHDKNKLVESNKAEIKARHERLKEFKKNKNAGPSFMSKHPLLTLGAGIVAGKAMSGGDNSKQEMPPQMIYPQY